MVKNYIYSEKIKNSTHIGKWGMLHREYLKKKYPLALTKMIQNGELREYLTVLDKRADCRYRFLIKEIRQVAGLSDEMKQISPMEWRAAMKVVTDKAEKIVKKEFVYILPKV